MTKTPLLQNNIHSWHCHTRVDCSCLMDRIYESHLKNRQDTSRSKHHFQKFDMPVGKYSDITRFNQYLKSPLQRKKRKR